MKYDCLNTVDAIYTDSNTKNPYLEAMPELLSKTEFKDRIGYIPKTPFNLEELSKEDRRQLLSEIYKTFIPLEYVYYIYDMLFRAILDNYSSKGTIDSIRQIQKLYSNYITTNQEKTEYSTQSFSGSLLGIPGTGKTTAIKKSLSLIPQVIIHENYQDIKMYQKQITYLIVECPSDCSVKTLAYSIIAAVDNAIGSSYFNDFVKKNKMTTVSVLAVKVKIICLNHHIGLIVIDEIQNVISAAETMKQKKPLIQFLVELTNEAYVSICFSGTLKAEELFKEHEHLKRRTRGYHLLPMKYDQTFYSFLKSFWNCQFTLCYSKLTESIMKLIFKYSNGIPSYIVKIYVEAQSLAIMTGTEKITIEIIEKVVKLLNIEPQITYSKGISISDFENTINREAEEIKINKRGRPTQERENTDLISIYKNSKNEQNFLNDLMSLNLLERIRKENVC